MKTELTGKEIEKIFEDVKNWGRWGAEDQRGALNLITPEVRARAAALATDGDTVSCGRTLPVQPSVDNPTPALHMMLIAGDALEATGVPGLETALDFVGVGCHGMAVSHIDALCHVFVKGQMYNGFPATDVMSVGAMRNSIEVAHGGIVGRGVLLDIPKLRGEKWLEPRARIDVDELSAAEEAQGVHVGEGDVLLVSTGRDARRAEHGAWDPLAEGLAGLDPNCIPWLRERDIAVIGSDGVSDPLPPTSTDGWPIPVHQCCLVGMGVHLLDNLCLDVLSDVCAAKGRYEFLFTVSPLKVERATGTAVNPIALF